MANPPSMTPFVVLLTPSFRGEPSREYVLSMLKTWDALRDAGIGHDLVLLAGDPYLSKVRNRLLSMFLTNFPMATDAFFLDDDIGWDAAKVIEFVRREQDILFGAYPKKQDNLDFPVSLDLEAGKLVEDDGLYRATLAPTGFMRIKRHVIEAMAQRVGRYMAMLPDGSEIVEWNFCDAKWVDPAMEALRTADLDALSKDEAIAHLKRAVGVTTPTDIGKFWGEDYWLVERWREMGGTVWCDPEIQFTHRGSKAWSARLGDSVRLTLQAMNKEAA